MPLILAIEPDRKQAGRVTALARGLPGAELVLADSTDQALASLAGRVPNLILTSLLLSPKDEAGLRALNGSGAPVPTLMIPVFATTTAPPSGRSGFLARLPWSRAGAGGPAPGTTGCDPSVFASQIWEYLQSSARDNEAREEAAPQTARRAAPEAEPQASTEAVPQEAAPQEVAPEEPAPEATFQAAPEAAFQAAAEAEPEAEPEPQPEEVQPLALSEAELVEEESAWDAITIDDDDASSSLELSEPTIELSGETIDLRAFVQELEAAEREFATLEVAASGTAESDVVEIADEPSDPLPASEIAPTPASMAPPVAFVAAAIEEVPRVTIAHALPDQPLWPPLEGVLAEELSPEELLTILADFDAPLEDEPDTPGTVDADGDLWMPLSVGGSPSWPRLENAHSKPRAPQDEWGFFDPEQCGFSALIAKLDQIAK